MMLVGRCHPSRSVQYSMEREGALVEGVGENPFEDSWN